MVQGLLSRHPPLHVQLLRTSPGSAQNEGKWLAFWLRKNQFSPDVSKKIRRALRREQDKPTETKRKIATMNILIQQARRGLQGRSAPALRDIRKATKAHITLTDRLRSGYHRFWYEATQALRWSRGTYRDLPAMTRLNLTPSQRARIDTLAENYTTRFELRYPPETTLLNYGYLDLLDRASQTLNWSISRNQKICDVGSSHFAYAAALQAFFHPSTLSELKWTDIDCFVMDEVALITRMAIFKIFHTRTMWSQIIANTTNRQKSSQPGIPSSHPNRSWPGAYR